MDLTSALSGLQQSKTLGEVQIQVAKKALDAQRSQGAAAIQLIQAATGAANGPGDELVAAATGLGGTVDTYG
jgi:hypothetical protein